MSPISSSKIRAKKRGLIFFSIIFIIILFMQISNYINGKDFEWLLILAGIFSILVCKYFFNIENYMKNRGWI